MSETEGITDLRSLLENTYRRKLQEVAALFKEWSGSPDGTRPTINQLTEDNPVVRETVELESWLHPEYDLLEERSRRAESLTEQFDQAGFPYEVIERFRKAILERRKGAPIKPATRRLAILALEAKRTDPRFSWMRFAHANCDCEARPHDIRCKERIRQAAIALRRLLDRLGVTY